MPAYDVYRGKTNQELRMATLPGAGLPNHVEAKDWELMAPGSSQIIDEAADDIAARGFCFYQLVDP